MGAFNGPFFAKRPHGVSSAMMGLSCKAVFATGAGCIQAPITLSYSSWGAGGHEDSPYLHLLVKVPGTRGVGGCHWVLLVVAGARVHLPRHVFSLVFEQDVSPDASMQ